MSLNRRNFFASAIAFIAALFTPKPTTTLSAAPAGSATTLFVLDAGDSVWEIDGTRSFKLTTPSYAFPFDPHLTVPLRTDDPNLGRRS